MDEPSESNLRALWVLVSSIPKGKCTSYGRLGRALPRPVSGYIVGRWMAQAPDGLPWWRVVSKDGQTPLDNRDPNMGLRQRELLAHEGVQFVDGNVDMKKFLYELN